MQENNLSNLKNENLLYIQKKIINSEIMNKEYFLRLLNIVEENNLLDILDVKLDVYKNYNNYNFLKDGYRFLKDNYSLKFEIKDMNISLKFNDDGGQIENTFYLFQKIFEDFNITAIYLLSKCCIDDRKKSKKVYEAFLNPEILPILEELNSLIKIKYKDIVYDNYDKITIFCGTENGLRIYLDLDFNNIENFVNGFYLIKPTLKNLCFIENIK